MTRQITATPPPPSGDTLPAPFRHSLLLRLTLALSALVLVMSAALFFGIDHFVSRQFNDLRADRLGRLATQVRQLVDQEQHQLESIARLLAADTELRNNTYYHLYLEGERTHPQAVIDRIVQAFHIDAVALWTTDGRLIAANIGAPTGRLRPMAPTHGAVEWLGGRPWMVAVAPVRRSEERIAYLQLARPLDQLFRLHGFGPDSEYPVEIATTGRHDPKGLQIPLPTTGERPLWVRLSIPDTVGQALAEVKRLLPLILAGGALLIAFGFVLFLRWQLRPLMQLTRAVGAVGRGDFGIALTPSGSREVYELMSAYNRMTADLAGLRRKERQWQHERQLSAIGRVAAKVAHDINNPLTVIRNIVRLMQRRDNGDAQAGEDLRLLEHHCERAIRIVEDLLHYGRPVRLSRTPLELAGFCRGRAEEWGRRTGTRVEFAPDREPLPVEADPLQLEQLLENLLNNARQAAPEAPVALRCERRDGEARVILTDGGPGFSEEARAHLFEPFFTTKDGGSGLGLASSLSIARAHGGTIEIADDRRGEVTLILPLTE